MKKKILLLLDGNALIHRSYHALPPLTDTKGRLVNAVYGFAAVLLKVMNEFKPAYIAAAFDVSGGTFRDEKFADYKANRQEADQELYDQIPIVKDMVKSLGIPILEKKRFEADDVIGTIVNLKNVDKPDVETIIVTGDMDTVQLIDVNTKVYTLRKGVSDTVLMDEHVVKERYGFSPKQMIDYKGLAGDASDNIPGVRGIGEKTATSLLQAFGTLDGIYTALKKNDKRFAKFPDRVKKLLTEGEKSARLSYELATINQDAPITFSFEAASADKFNRDEAINTFRELGFKSLMTKIPESKVQGSLELPTAAQPKKPAAGKYTVVDSDEAFKTFLADLKKQKSFAVDTETTSLNVRQAELLGMSFSWKAGHAYYVNLNNNQGTENHVHFRHAWFTKLKPILKDPDVAKVGHNLKYDLAVIERAGGELRPLTVDTMVVAYLLHPEQHQNSLDSLAMTEFGHTMIPITQLIGKGKTQRSMQTVPVLEIGEYAAEDADFTWRLHETLTPQLEKLGAYGLLETIEMPLIPVLHTMESRGIVIDTAFLHTMSVSMGKRIKVLEAKAYKLAGQEFNLSSPIQLKQILFEKLDIDSRRIGVTKTGLSTAAAELEKLRGVHPMIDLILEYRELVKLTSTYINALPELIDSTTGRLHTSYNQTVAATGRLSSTDPNLQNIPIRTELGKEIRKAFITKRGWRLISADYSQIELRIIASLAQDEAMMKAFQDGDDIHARTAAEIHGKKIDEVTKEERRAAKAINFGIIYGMGTNSLARQTGLDPVQAGSFIERYFELHKGIREYLDQTKVLAKKLGYVETLFGRRRYIPEIQSNVRQLQAAGERIAVNMPVQGTAADLLKLAMIAVQKGLHKVSVDAAMLLTVHDELLFEAPEKDVAKVTKYVEETMKNVYKLRVPIEVSVSSGKNWGEAH